MGRVARGGGTVAAYVWDYAGQLQLARYFWHAATVLDPAATAHDQSVQFPLCHPEPLAALFAKTGLQDVAVEAIEVPTIFRDFDDYWQPHLLGGSAIAQRYVASLDEGQRTALRERTARHVADGRGWVDPLDRPRLGRPGHHDMSGGASFFVIRDGATEAMGCGTEFEPPDSSRWSTPRRIGA